MVPQDSEVGREDVSVRRFSFLFSPSVALKTIPDGRPHLMTTHSTLLLKNNSGTYVKVLSLGQTQWLTPVNPTPWEVEVKVSEVCEPEQHHLE